MRKNSQLKIGLWWNPMRLKNKVVLITGAGLGLGRALALALAGQGVRLALNDLTRINLDPLAAEIQAVGGEARLYENDISRKLDLQSLVQDVLADYGRIDVLVNHASVQPHHPILGMDEWDWRRTVDVILTGTFLASQSVGRVMAEQGGGVILNIGPRPGPQSAEPRAAYLAAKAGVLAFSRAAAEELAEHGVQVLTLEPAEDHQTSLAAALEMLAAA